jgi:deoxyribonuclease V
MEINQLQNWQVDIKNAKKLQIQLAQKVSPKNELTDIHLIAGSDIAAPDSCGIARAAVVVLKYPGLDIAEIQIIEDKLTFPYIPGLLSFRESPLLVAAFKKLALKPNLLLVDGQGIAHPRRLGIASHLGLLLNIPTVGCAKSRLCGWHKPLIEINPGSNTELIDGGAIIGTVLLTKLKTKPIYVSIGHKIDLPTAIFWVKECLNGYRLPEPCRLAHLAASNKQIISKPKLPKCSQCNVQ